VERWKANQRRSHSISFEYFETDHLNLEDPAHFETKWARLSGANLPPDVLEKFYHGNAERLIPGLVRK
jgi:hypothetical protein